MDLKMEAALDTRDALAKSIYAALFRCAAVQIWLSFSAAHCRPNRRIAPSISFLAVDDLV